MLIVVYVSVSPAVDHGQWSRISGVKQDVTPNYDRRKYMIKSASTTEQLLCMLRGQSVNIQHRVGFNEEVQLAATASCVLFRSIYSLYLP